LPPNVIHVMGGYIHIPSEASPQTDES
jgi:hypothetical protein